MLWNPAPPDCGRLVPSSSARVTREATPCDGDSKLHSGLRTLYADRGSFAFTDAVVGGRKAAADQKCRPGPFGYVCVPCIGGHVQLVAMRSIDRPERKSAWGVWDTCLFNSQPCSVVLDLPDSIAGVFPRRKFASPAHQ